MKPAAALELLEAAAQQLHVRVCYESLQSSVGHGGVCRVRDEFRVIIDKRATAEERVATLGAALASLQAVLPEGLEALVPKVISLIRSHEGSGRFRVRTATRPAA